MIDLNGDDVHTWISAYTPGNSVYLQEDGTLLRTGSLNNSNRFDSTGGSGGIIEKMNWQSNVLWSFEHCSEFYCQHHDVEQLPNGNILIIVWEYISDVEAVEIGRDPNYIYDNELWPDSIIEVDPDTDEIVWEWHMTDHLIQDFDSLKVNYGIVADHPELIDLNYGDGNADITHVNSIDYNEDFDQIILSVHGFDEFWVIDHSTTTLEAASHEGGIYGMGGDLLYRWGNPAAYRAGDQDDQVFYRQHDAQWIEAGLPGAGNILVYNNGSGRPDGAYSTVDEIAPDINGDGSYPLVTGSAFGPATKEWTYIADNPTDFYSQRISGAQRLPNGNTLICEGRSGYLFEVTYDGDIVWSYQNTDGTRVYRAYRYPKDYEGLSELGP